MKIKVTTEQIVGFSGSAIFCLLIILFLYFTFLHTKVNAGEEGIFVNFGTVDWASGTFEPKQEGENREIPTLDTSPETQQIQSPETPPVITQNIEQTVAIEDTKEKEKRIEQERQDAEKRRLVEEQRKKAEEEQRKREAINRQMSGAFGVGETPKGSEGTDNSGSDNQGSNQGNAATGSYSGLGGSGDFDLSGRTLGGGGLQRPAYAAQEEGTIVIEITVNPRGNVINADVRLKGTNIENSSMRRSAIDAAKRTKFNSINGTQNQIGTITYRYTLK